jgi:DNA repair photolyase
MGRLQLNLFDEGGPPEAPESFAYMKVTELEKSNILTKGSGAATDFDFTLNPYVGCGFNCSYCFATFFQAEEERRQTWGSWVNVKINAARDLLRRKDLHDKKIMMSTATDPYQPLEAKVKLTRAILEVLVDKQPRLLVQTRGPLVTRDIDLLKQLKHVRVNMSITTDSDEVRKRFEPSCASIERRLEAITECKEAGLKTTVCLVPMLPLDNPEKFADRLRATKADYFKAYPFRISDREFSASTRQWALDIAKEYGWDKDAFERAKNELQHYLPELNRGDYSFHPE